MIGWHMRVIKKIISIYYYVINDSAVVQNKSRSSLPTRLTTEFKKLENAHCMKYQLNKFIRLVKMLVVGTGRNGEGNGGNTA